MKTPAEINTANRAAWTHDAFKESEHPRKSNGEFGEGGRRKPVIRLVEGTTHQVKLPEGALYFANKGTHAFIEDVVVSEKHQRKGVATTLYGALREHLHDKGIHRVTGRLIGAGTVALRERTFGAGRTSYKDTRTGRILSAEEADKLVNAGHGDIRATSEVL